MTVVIRPPAPADDTLVLTAPPSKSQALRALMVAAIAGGGSIRGLSEPVPDDVRTFVTALRALDVPVDDLPDGWCVRGRWPDGLSSDEPLVVSAGEGAAPARFLLALAALTGRAVTVTGEGRLPERPMAPLLAALRSLGVKVTGGPGLPATVQGPPKGGRRIALDGRVSSQFLSALLMVAPAVADGIVLRSVGRQASLPYVDLTRAVMASFGVEVERDLVVPHDARYTPASLEIEADWSGGTVLLAAAPFLKRTVEVAGLDLESMQPDAGFARVLTALGLDVVATADGVSASGNITKGGTFDLGGFPDAVPALAALGALCPSHLVVEGVSHLRAKESDRIEALQSVLHSVGLAPEGQLGGLLITGGPLEDKAGDPVSIAVRGDHRIAMAAALVGLRRPVEIDDPDCVKKSFPCFFDRWPGVVA